MIAQAMMDRRLRKRQRPLDCPFSASVAIKASPKSASDTDDGLKVNEGTSILTFRRSRSRLGVQSIWKSASSLLVLVVVIFVLMPSQAPLLFATANAFSTRATETQSSWIRHRNQRQTYEINQQQIKPPRNHLCTVLWAHNGKEASLYEANDCSSSLLLPRHVAIICDGNSRWANARGLPAAAGHAAGADRLVQALETLQSAGVMYCTLYCFSTENWQRPATEIANLMRVMEQTARKCRSQVLASRARIKVLGDLEDERIPAGLRNVLTEIEQATCHDEVANDTTEPRQTVSLAINYGGRRDILNAAKQLAKKTAASANPSNAIDSLQEEDLACHLGTHGIPDPDLLIRTSGEHRLSNFLLWNSAYAEIYFTETLWPDFDADCIAEALTWYAQRHRRFGSRETVVHTRSL